MLESRRRRDNAVTPDAQNAAFPEHTGQCIAVLETGGTIAIGLNTSEGDAISRLSSLHLLDSLPSGLPPVRVEEVVSLPSSHFQLDTLWSIRDKVAAVVSEPDVAGVVVTHGTDTIEETAYLLDLTVPTEKPVVLTGAIRTAVDVGYDGRANLLAALRVAANPQVEGLGAVVVMNHEIHAAQFVTKAHTLSLAGLQSLGWGPVGYLLGGSVVITQYPKRHTLPWQGLEPNVMLFKLGVGMQTHLIDYALSRGVRGIVIESFGSGRVPPWWISAIDKARTWGVAVVVASRCPSGPLWDSYSYEGSYGTLKELGCLFADSLNGQKARIKLMVVLAAAQTPQEVAELWLQ